VGRACILAVLNVYSYCTNLCQEGKPRPGNFQIEKLEVNMDDRKTSYRITDLQVSERPRERLAELGAGALSEAELLAILLRVGVAGENAVQVAQRLLHDFGSISGLYRAPFEEVCNQRGVGTAKAAQIKAAIELGHRMSMGGSDSRPVIHSPGDAADLVKFEMSLLEQEELRAMLLDTRNRVITTETIYKGSLNSSHMRVCELFRYAIRINAAAIIVVHNHPSGDPTPSPDDVVVTRAIVQAGKLLDIDVLDHLIIGKGQFISLKERGLGF
jgi:DNA repair protein RadC